MAGSNKKRTKSRSRSAKSNANTNTNTTSILIIILVACILLHNTSSNTNILSDIRYTIISGIPSIIKTIYRENEQTFNIIKFLSDLANILFWIIGSGYFYYYKYNKNPREHIISVQMNVVTGVVSDKDHINSSSITQCDTEEDAWEGKLVWNVISEAPAPDDDFQKLLRLARKKPRALQKECPTLELLDTGPYNVKSFLWQNIYGLASTHLVNTHALSRGAVGVKVKRYRFIGCLTYVTAVGKHPKMRLLVVSRKQLKFLHDNPDYGSENDSKKRVGFFSQKWNCSQRLVQLQELGCHVKATGGFDDSTYTDQNHHKDGVDRYYFGIEVWL